MRCLPLLALILLTATVSVAEDNIPKQSAKIVQVRKIWDAGAHNAFTDLVRHGDAWYCVFREAKGHVSPDGKIRVITSTDGNQWKSAALIARKDSDLRDPKICRAPDGRLMLLAAASWHGKGVKVNRQPMVWFSKDGRSWGKGADVAEANSWLWRVTWHKGVARGVGYGRIEGRRRARLYESRDGLKFKTLVPTLHDRGYPNETSILYLPEDTALCLLRRDGSPNTGLLGTAKAPYTKWTWKDLGVRIGGPHMIRLDDGRIVAATRRYDRKVRTSLSWLDARAGRLTEFLKLPSGGDTSYPGLAMSDGLLWVSYYSSHEGKTSIYLAKVRLPNK